MELKKTYIMSDNYDATLLEQLEDARRTRRNSQEGDEAMSIFDLFRKNKPVDEKRELTAEEKEWLEAFRSVLEELVPGEKFELVAHPEPSGATRFELVTESKRALVAWAEVQEVLKPTTPEPGGKV